MNVNKNKGQQIKHVVFYQEDAAAILNIRKKYKISNDSEAIRFTLRNFTELKK